MSRPDTYRFDLGEQQLIYAPLADLAALLSRRDCDRLLADSDVSDELSGELARLAALLRQEVNRPGVKSGELAPEMLGLVTTRACNMSCAYCDFAAGSDSDSSLTIELAFAAIEEMGRLVSQQQQDLLKVHFFGGEPFQAWDLVRLSVERTRAVANEHGLTPFLEATTNGLYPQKRAEWIARSFDRVVLSLDGLPEVQDAARPDRRGRPTSARVEESAAIFSDATVELNLRLCVAAAGVGQLPESILYLLEERRFRPTTITVEPVRSLTSGHPVSPPAPAAFVNAFLACLSICEERGVLLHFSGADLGAKVASLCPVGRDGFIVHPDGLVAACYLRRSDWQERGLELAYGQIDPQRGLITDSRRLQAVRRLVVDAIPACADCFCRWHCAGGCQVHRATAELDRHWCTITRAISFHLLLCQAGIEPSQPSLEVTEQPVRWRQQRS